MSKIIEAVTRALDWLDANPTKHIIGQLAVDTKGGVCYPNSPQAECFCVLGRVSKELDLPGYPLENPDFKQLLTEIKVQQDDIYGMNDDYQHETLEAHCPRRDVSRGDVRDWLRKKLTGHAPVQSG